MWLCHNANLLKFLDKHYLILFYLILKQHGAIKEDTEKYHFVMAQFSDLCNSFYTGNVHSFTKTVYHHSNYYSWICIWCCIIDLWFLRCLEWLINWLRSSNVFMPSACSPVRRQAIIWINDVILSIEPMITNYSENLIKTQQFSYKTMHVKTSSARWRGGHFVSASMC